MNKSEVIKLRLNPLNQNTAFEISEITPLSFLYDISVISIFPTCARTKVGKILHDTPHMEHVRTLFAAWKCGMWENRESAKRETILYLLLTLTS